MKLLLQQRTVRFGTPFAGVALFLSFLIVGCGSGGSIPGVTNSTAKTTPVSTLASTQNPATTGTPVTFMDTLPATTTGTVTFSMGSLSLGTGTVSGGVARLTTAALPPGNDPITATYGGDTNNNSSVASMVEVVSNPTAGTLTPSISVTTSGASVLGDSVTITTTLPMGATGSVTVTSGGSTLGTATVTAGGTAVVTTTTLPVGIDVITASYGGDSNYNAASSSTTQTVSSPGVVKASPPVIVTTSGSSVFGGPVVITATVPAGLTGTITFTSGGVTLGMGALPAGGTFVIVTTSVLPVGTDTVTANYSGDANNNPESGSTTQVVTPPSANKVTPTVLVTTSGPSIFGANVTITATLPVGTTGLVIVTLGTFPLGQGYVGTDGTVSIITNVLPIGSSVVTANYAGDANNNPNTGTATQVVTKGAPSITLASSLNPAAVGQTVSFIATLPTVTTGIVTFNDGATVLGTGTLNNGIATFGIATLAAGTHTITASYGGDVNDNPSTSGPLTETIGKATPVLAAPVLSALTTDDVTPVTMAETVPAGVPGPVSFYNGTTLLGTANVVGGTATLTVPSLTAGTDSITAVTPADANNNSATSPATIITVTHYVQLPTGAVVGTVKAGSQFVVGASIQLYVAGSTGNGTAGTALLSTPLVSDANGNFGIAAGFSCPTPTTQIYVVARGGTVAGQSAANSAIAYLATLGTCSSVTSSRVIMNEVTTLANVWAMSQFMAPGGTIGTSATNTVGIANAVATAANLANPATGLSPGAAFPANGVSPATRINSLANLLNACTSSTASSTACTNVLGTNADVLDAALSIVRSPGTNVATLYAQSLGSTAFSPVLSAAPSDWTLFISYSGGGMKSPSGLGIDGLGNVWVSSYFSATGSDQSVGSVTEFSPVGKPVFPAGITGMGLNNIYGLAIDAQNNIWIPNQESAAGVNQGLGSVTEINSTGVALSGATGYVAGGVYYPTSIAIDTDGTAWVAEYGDSYVSHLSSAGLPLSGTSGYTAGTINFPDAIAVDGNHNAWVGNQIGNTVNKVAADGTVTSYNCCDGPNGLALDQAGNVWVANLYGDSVSEITAAGVVASNGGSTAGGTLAGPQGIAVDGAGNIWVGNFRAAYLTELAGATSTTPAAGAAISPLAGWAPDAKLEGAFSVAIDASGNLWVTNFNNDTITEFVGMSSPVKTPLLGLPVAP